MALLVWLPLNGTLENKGINLCTFINSGAVINDNGKIGLCYDITNGSIYCPNFSLSNTTFSVFCWVKFTSFSNNSNAYIVSLSNLGTTAEEIQFFLGIYKASANDYALISINLGSNKFGLLYTDTWYHIGLTCQNNTVLIYLNGLYIGTRNISAYVQLHLVIGGRSDNSSSTSFVGRPRAVINDVRIYNHVLSKLEIKEIYLTLILHYKFDDSSIESTYNYVTASLSNANYSTATTVYSSSSTNSYYTLSSSIPLDGNGIYYLSCYVDNTNNSGGVRLGLDVDGNTSQYRTLTNVILPGKQGYVYALLDLTDTSIYSTATSGTLRYWFTKADGTGNLKRNELASGSTDSIRYFLIEKKDHPTLWTLGQTTRTASNVIIDSSGYNNNGTITGNLTTGLQSARYNLCTYFNSYNNYVSVNNFSNILSSLNNCSISWWQKNNSDTKCIPFAGQDSAKYIGAGSPTVNFYCNGINAGNCRLFVDSIENTNKVLKTGTAYKFQSTVYDSAANGYKWHHYVLTNVDLSTWTIFKINNYNSTSSYPLNSYMSDVRIYATTLDDNDIKNLYNIGMKIDKKNNLHSFEYNEPSNNIKLFKTGILQEDEINEISGNTLFKKTGQIYAPEFIER